MEEKNGEGGRGGRGREGEEGEEEEKVQKEEKEGEGGDVIVAHRICIWLEGENSKLSQLRPFTKVKLN